MPFWGSPLLDPKKLQNQQFYIIDWIRKNSWSTGRCCQSGYLLWWWLWCTIAGLGTLSKCYVSSPVAKTLILDWKSWLAQLFLDVFLGLSPLLDPKKLQNEQFYIIDWIWKKLLVDVANLATCCHDDYDVLLEVLGTLHKCYVKLLILKLFWVQQGWAPGRHPKTVVPSHDFQSKPEFWQQDY